MREIKEREEIGMTGERRKGGRRQGRKGGGEEEEGEELMRGFRDQLRKPD